MIKSYEKIEQMTAIYRDGKRRFRVFCYMVPELHKNGVVLHKRLKLVKNIY